MYKYLNFIISFSVLFYLFLFLDINKDITYSIQSFKRFIDNFLKKRIFLNSGKRYYFTFIFTILKKIFIIFIKFLISFVPLYIFIFVYEFEVFSELFLNIYIQILLLSIFLIILKLKKKTS